MPLIYNGANDRCTQQHNKQIISNLHFVSASGSNPEEIKKDMRGWLHNELDEKLSKELRQIDFNSLEGKEYLDSLTSEILDIWKQE